jgi:hypothetical protein
MKIDLGVFDFIAKPNPERLNRYHDCDDCKSCEDGRNESILRTTKCIMICE